MLLAVRAPGGQAQHRDEHAQERERDQQPGLRHGCERVLRAREAEAVAVLVVTPNTFPAAIASVALAVVLRIVLRIVRSALYM